MTRLEAVKKIINSLGKTDLLVVSTGFLCRDVYQIKDRPGNFYMYGSMGDAFSIGIGLALFTQKKVIVVSGDGAALMNLGSLVTGNHLKLKNLLHYIIDNHAYGSTGEQPTCSDAIDFTQFFNTVYLEVEKDELPSPRIPLTPKQIKERFMEELTAYFS